MSDVQPPRQPASMESGAFEWMPLSHRQGVIWRDERLDLGPKSFGYRAMTMRTGASVDRSKLRRAWESALAAHDALRLVLDPEGPRQRLVDLSPAILEASSPDGSDMDRWIAEMAGRAFDPALPSWDLALLGCGDGRTVSLFRAHHLLCDETSFRLLAEEVAERCLSASRDAAASFRAFLSEEGLPEARERIDEDAEAYRGALSDPPPQASLLGCAPKEASDSLARIEAALSDSRCDMLSARSGILAAGDLPPRLAVDCVMAALAIAWVHLLSGQRDIVVSMPIEGRGPAYSRAVGPFDGIALLRVGFDEGETFATLSAKVRASLLFSLRHPRAPEEGQALTSACIGALPGPAGACLELGASFDLVDVPPKVASSPASGFIAPRIRYSLSGPSRRLRFEFPEGMYAQPIRESLVSYYLRLLDALLADPGKSFGAADLLDDAEREDLLRLGLGREMPPAEDLLSAFARNARENPGRSAVEFGDSGLSYAELDRATNRLARRLRSHGVAANSRVAVAMPRGLGEYCAFLAVMKAGGAYVPVDIAHPAERIRLIMEDAEPQVLVAPPGSPLLASLPPDLPCLELEDPARDGADVDDGPLEGECDPEQLAYLIFTSGTTGRPKGVAIRRGGLANFLNSASREPGISRTERLAAISTTTFDMSVLDFFLPLYVGATVVIVDRPSAVDPARLRAVLERTGSTMMQATPTTWRMLLDAGWSGHRSFRMLTGGEAISLALERRLQDCGAELWNMYGPTETTVYSSVKHLTRDMERITVGRPVDNTRMSVRDAGGRLIPAGVIGEICISGRGLALGYHGRPDLTADRFPTDPRSGERFYRTGDLGRWLPDGQLECLGRVDHQVKIRGFRIEPADIEAQLRTVAGVKDALVVALRHGEGDPQLVAYWVGSATREELYACAKAKLPYYMVPSGYVRLDAFPLTTTGKVDRKQLPAPESRPDDGEAGLAPRNDQESIVASIWREVLGLSFVPVDVDFFSLGGTSIRSIQVRNRIKESLGVDLPLKAIFEHPTVEGIVSQLGNPEAADAPIVSLLAQGRDPIPWIGLMGVQLFDDIARSLPDSHSLLAIHVPVRYVPGVDAFPTVQELARKYLEVIRQRQPEGPYYLLGLCHGGVVAFEAAAQLEEAGERVAMVVLLDAELPLARRTKRLLRFWHELKRLLSEPRASMKQMGAKMVLRFPAFKRIGRERDPAMAPLGARHPIDFPFDGPEIDIDLAAYQALDRQVGCEVVTFRATKSDIAPWLAVSPDLGWSGRAKRLSSYDIPSSHLGIVRGEHAKEIARLMTEIRRRNS